MARTMLRWMKRIVIGLVSFVVVIALLAAGAIYVLSGTDWGHERVRRIALSALGKSIHGRLSIGSISGNLLTGMTVRNVAIADSSGAPFVSLESFSGTYSLAALLHKRIWIGHAVAVRPRIVLDRPPNGEWNWQRIFPAGAPSAAPQAPGWLDWLRFTDARVEEGQLVVRTPWNPSTQLTPAARDSAIRDALDGKSRLMITRAAGGFQKLVQLDSVNARIPLLRLAEPGQANRVIEVSSLSMNAFPFRPPGAVVRDLRGSFPFSNDSVWWKSASAALPNTRANGDGSYVFDSGDMTLGLHADPVSFADVRWIYPRLPANGNGSGDLRLAWRGAVQDYAATNTHVALGDTRVNGSIGVTLGDTITLHDTDLRFSALDTHTLEQLIQDFKSPRQGTFSGRATLRGGRHALALAGDVIFHDRRAGTSHVTASGEVGFLENKGVRARDLRLRLFPLQVAMVRSWYPSLPIAGSVTGTATLNGTTRSDLVVDANLDHRDRGTRSVLDGSAAIHLAAVKRFDVNVDARPISLEEVGRFFPAAGLQGSAAGPVRLSGTISALRVNVDLRLPDGGRFATVGTLDLASANKGYDLTSTLHTLNLRTIDSKAPVTSLSARAAVHGRGTTLASVNATASADLSASRYVGGGPRDSVALDTASVRARIANGRVAVDTLYAVGANTSATASGSFGIIKEQTGTLAFSVSTDSLGAFNRLLPRDTVPHAAAVPPRPAVVARAYQRARADSTRVAKATEMERLVNGRPGPALKVSVPAPVPADTVSGKLAVKGSISGNIYGFDLRGTAIGQNVVARGNSARRFRSDFSWTKVRTPDAAIAASVDADTVSAMGFAFDSVTANGTYTPAGGHLQLAVTQNASRRYTASGDYALEKDRKELHLASLALRFDTTSWSMTQPSVIRWGGPGLQINDFELRNASNGRIVANGLLPTEGVADFALAIENFPLANLVDILQTDVNVTGIATANVSMSGTLGAPGFRGTFGLTNGTYNGVTVPTLNGRIGYADRVVVAHVDALRASGQPMTTVDGRIPINLALSGVTGSRILPDPMSVDLVADSLPLELIPQFTDLVSDFHGKASGKVSVRGTVNRPALSGDFALANGSVVIGPTGGKLVDADASLHMANDTVYVDSIVAHTKTGRAIGTVRTRGTIAVGNWREPSFKLYLVSNGAQLLNNNYGNLRVDAGIAFTGPLRDAYLSGAVTLVQGVIYAPEPGTMHALIGAGDPALYNVIDTTSNERDLFPTPSPVMANMRIELELAIKHDTWVRNREANVEIYTDDPLDVRQEQGSFFLTGAVATDRGEYEFLSKRFQIKRGSALFIGTPDLDPTLQITGEYQVDVAARGALNIRVIVGGTLHRPKISLESDAQPPKTQSELLSLLAFGQSSSTLIASNTSSISGSGATSDLGVGAEAAVQRFAGVALGVAVQQVEMQAGRAFGTDVFDITPGDVPLFNNSGPRDFFIETRIEAGKYVNPRTYVSVQEQAGLPGLSLEQRTPGGWRFFVSTAPRILLGEPTLSLQPTRTVQSYGGFVLREWRF
ncbi:MAG TPA: translocation/assembly module TamB domain-containing protein [Gemmatimonadaceae bacterium]|nr:translocation/assembly module TamB domain-containing protein [Gemmatimonadaceae bacterium]